MRYEVFLGLLSLSSLVMSFTVASAGEHYTQNR